MGKVAKSRDKKKIRKKGQKKKKYREEPRDSYRDYSKRERDPNELAIIFL